MLPTPLYYALVFFVVHTVVSLGVVLFVQYHRWRTCHGLPSKFAHVPHRGKLSNFGIRESKGLAYYAWTKWVDLVSPSLANHVAVELPASDDDDIPPHAATPLPVAFPERCVCVAPPLSAAFFLPVPFANRVLPVYLVETRAQLSTAAKHLQTHRTVAVDVEHHHDRSYQGQTCLIQLGTRDCCFLLDPLRLPRLALGRYIRELLSDHQRVLIFHSVSSRYT